MVFTIAQLRYLKRNLLLLFPRFLFNIRQLFSQLFVKNDAFDQLVGDFGILVEKIGNSFFDFLNKGTAQIRIT